MPGAITRFMGLADWRLWDPERRAAMADRTGMGAGELENLSAGGLRWGGTMGGARRMCGGQGYGFGGSMSDMFRKLIEARMGGGEF